MIDFFIQNIATPFCIGFIVSFIICIIMENK